MTAHPLGFWFFFWGEFAERCSYYGMRAILLLYMVNRLGFSDARGSVVMSCFMAACYLLPLAGGYVADNYLGKYRTIVFFSLPYIIGQVILGIENVPFLIIALSLLAMGSGVIKPNISTLMGLTYDQQRPGETKLRSDAFAIFYGSINIGAAISSFAMPWIRDRWGYQIAFLFPAGLMAVALLIFASGKRFYAVETIRRRDSISPEERHERLVVLRRILALFVVVTFFWAIFDQSATSWTLFARDHLVLDFMGIHLAPDMLQGLNPILIIILFPPITVLWRLLARLGREFAAHGQNAHRLPAHGDDNGHHVGGRILGRSDGPRFRPLGSDPVRAHHDGGNLHLRGRPGIGVRGRPPVNEELRHRMLAADGLLRRLPQRMDHALLSVDGETCGGDAAIHTRAGHLFRGAALVMAPVTIAFVLAARRFNQPVHNEQEGDSKS